MALFDRNTEDEFRAPIGTIILIQAILALVYIIPIESDPSFAGLTRFRVLEPVLYLTPFVTTALVLWRAALGRWFAALSPAAVILAMQFWLPIPGSLALLAIATGIAGAVIGPRAAALVTAFSLGGMLGLRALGAAVDPWQMGIAVAATLTTLLLTLSTHRTARDAAEWSRAYYHEALQMMRESRARQGDLQKALDDLSHANRQLTLLYEKQGLLQRVAEEAERAKSNFVAKVSHEFRTPLNMIIGLASVMIENPGMYGRALPAALLEDLRIIYRNCDHLSSLVNDVLALSQTQAGGVVLQRESLDLLEVLRGALDVVRPLLHQKRLALTLHLPEHLPPVSCDRTRMRQVILNLLSNAARFTDRGGITVRVTAEEKGVTIAVSDTGPGIAAADMGRIFEPFCQGSEQVWREKGGSGLGLTISKQFVELHGGRIWLESQLGQGTTFFVYLPQIEPLPPVRLPAGWVSREWAWLERKNPPALPRLPDLPRIVVFDATQEIAPGVRRFTDQVELVSGDSLEEALAEAETVPAHALLLGASSAESLPALLRQAARRLPDTPLLGWALPQRMSPALRAGADHYLVKPVNLASLREKIASFARPIRRVLVVDDDDETRELLARMLVIIDAQVQVEMAARGDQALDRLAKEPFDLMLLDVMMPEVGGLQVLETVRGSAALRGLPVIVISAQDLYETEPVCSEMLLAFGKGIPLPKALECAVGFSQILATPLAEPHPAPGVVPAAE